MNDRDTQIKQATQAIKAVFGSNCSVNWESEAKKIVDAINASPKPAYPTDEMVAAYREKLFLSKKSPGNRDFEASRAALAAASAVDPVHQAAIAAAETAYTSSMSEGVYRLRKVAREAGLLDD